MTDLTKALKELEFWLWLNHPNICSPLLPGLTDKQIDEECESLLSDIPEEVRDFYRWRNGASNVFYSTHHGEELSVLPLGKAVDLTIDVTGGGNITRQLESKQINNAFFMFRGFECWYHYNNDIEDYRSIFMKYNTDSDDIRKQYGDSIDMYLDL